MEQWSGYQPKRWNSPIELHVYKKSVLELFLRLFFSFQKEIGRRLLLKCKKIRIIGKLHSLGIIPVQAVYLEIRYQIMQENFIVNAGNASAADVLALIQHVKDTIFSLYEIEMETEVEIIGRN